MESVMVPALFCALVVLASFGLRVIEGMERDNRLAEAELQASQMYRESLGSRVEQVRRYRHDADGLLRAVEHSLGRGSEAHGVEAAIEARGFAGGEPEPRLGSENCRLPLADAAIQSKRLLCAEVGIEFLCEVDPDFAVETMRRGVSEPDLCIVLQNLLDNAYEASLEAKAAGIEPAMSLRLGMGDGCSLCICISNRTTGRELPDFRTRKANPKLHGVGLQVVNGVARSYGGNVVPNFDAGARSLTMTVKL